MSDLARPFVLDPQAIARGLEALGVGRVTVVQNAARPREFLIDVSASDQAVASNALRAYGRVERGPDGLLTLDMTQRPFVVRRRR